MSKILSDTRDQDPLLEELTKYIQTGDALDIGAGWKGRDAFYLANLGFQVTAVEPDKKAVAELRKRNSISEHKLTVVEAGIMSYHPDIHFDVVVSDMVLHFLKDAEISPAIHRLQQLTRPGGYNVVMAYTERNPAGKRPYLFAPDELANYYQDWEMLHYAEEPTPWFRLEGEKSPRRNHAVYLLARKTR